MKIACSKCGRKFNAPAWGEAIRSGLKMNKATIAALRLVCVECVAAQTPKKETAK